MAVLRMVETLLFSVLQVELSVVDCIFVRGFLVGVVARRCFICLVRLVVVY